ncbi:MAG: FeoA family protein [Nitrososphaerota archaeon]|nr:ferrous iron transport protein A [Nitrososphaerales archaeon]MDW8044955.1 FeoA family protein [Nitrososphaerota archaeon]
MEGSAAKKNEVPLTALKDGQVGIVTSIKVGYGRAKGQGYRKRLMDMGFIPGTKVTVVKSAPFHGPLEVLVRSSRIILGRDVAERVFVEVVENG